MLPGRGFQDLRFEEEVVWSEIFSQNSVRHLGKLACLRSAPQLYPNFCQMSVFTVLITLTYSAMPDLCLRVLRQAAAAFDMLSASDMFSRIAHVFRFRFFSPAILISATSSLRFDEAVARSTGRTSCWRVKSDCSPRKGLSDGLSLAGRF